MKYRELGRTGWQVSEVSFGAWAIGGDWAHVPDDDAIATLHKAIDMGVNFIDTADVYGDGRSERLVGKVVNERSEEVHVATKMGRRATPHVVDSYNKENMTSYIERSLKNLGTDCVDLVQLHCPPTEVYYHPEVFGILDDLVAAGKIRYYGVSVEKVEEALKAIEYPNVQSVQIIFNILRHRPIDLFFTEAKRRKVGILTRLPLASGVLAGKMTRETTWPEEDHRNWNRDGAKMDIGETFSGVDFETALDVVGKIKPMVPAGATMAQYALRWILMYDAVTCVIPGGRRPSQVEDNARASDLPPLSASEMQTIRELYDTYVFDQVHHRW